MKKIIFFSALFVIGLLLFLGVPTPLRAADPTPLPAAQDNAALIAKINGLYYNYKTLGLRKFKCEVKVNLFNDALEMMKSKLKKDDDRIKAIQDIRFFMTYDDKNGYKFVYTGYKPTGDTQTDTNLMKIINGIEQIVGGFWQSWSSVTFEPAIDSAKTTVTVKKTGTGYEVTEQKDKSKGINIMDNDLLISEVDGYKEDETKAAMSIKPTFLKTPQGLILQAAVVDVPGEMNEDMTIQYQPIQKFEMPSAADFTIEMLGSMKNHVTIQFTQFQLN